MTRLTLRLIAVLAALSLAVLGVVVTPSEAFACSCVRTERQSAERRADAIFYGRVTETRIVRRPAPGRIDIAFEVEQVYKGSVYQRQVVGSPIGEGGCGLDLRPGSTWVIFAEEQVEGSGDATFFRLTTSLCSGNVTTTSPPEGLGTGRPPISGASDRVENAVTTDAAYTRVLQGVGMGAGGLVLLAGIGLAVLWRPGRSRA